VGFPEFFFVLLCIEFQQDRQMMGLEIVILHCCINMSCETIYSGRLGMDVYDSFYVVE
jgi:hypothetical protein